MVIFSVVLTAWPAAACHSQTIACDGVQTSQGGVTIEPPSRTVAPGGSTEYHITATLSPGCGSTYYQYSTLGSVPAGWTATYMSGPGKTGADISNYDNVQCGSGSCTVHAYLNVTAALSLMEGSTAVISVTLGFDDTARNDKRVVTIKTTTKIHIPDPIPQVVSPLVGWSMAEDTTDETHINLSTVFKDPDDDKMSYGWDNPGTSNFVVSVYSTGRTVVKPKQDWSGEETLNFWGSDMITKVPTSVKVTVTPVPDPVVLAAPMKDFAIPQDGVDVDSVNLYKVFFDPDMPYGEVLTFTHSGEDKINVSIRIDGKVTFKPLMGWSGSENINFTATDTGKTTVGDEVKVVVTNNAKPPYVKIPLKDRSFPEDTVDTSIDLAGVFASPNAGTVLTYGNMGAPHLNISMTADGKVTLTPQKYWHGSDTITFWATDGMFAPVFTDAKITVTHVNHQPYVKKPLTITMQEDTPSEATYMEYYFGDYDGDTLTYSMKSTEELTVTVYQQNAHLIITPVLNWNGEETLTLVATDGDFDVSVQVPVTVKPVDDTPVIIDWLPGGNVICTEGDELSFTVTAKDFDGSTLGYLWIVDENFTPLKPYEGKNAIKVRATKENGLGAGTHDVKVFADKQTSDGTGWVHSDHCWKITVNFGNRAPLVSSLTILPSENITTKTIVSFDVLANDPDLDNLNYKWSIDGLEKSQMKTFSTALTEGTHTVNVTVTDPKGASTSQESSITVTKPVTKPGVKTQPGFEGLAILAALGAIAVILRKRK